MKTILISLALLLPTSSFAEEFSEQKLKWIESQVTEAFKHLEQANTYVICTQRGDAPMNVKLLNNIILQLSEKVNIMSAGISIDNQKIIGSRTCVIVNKVQ